MGRSSAKRERTVLVTGLPPSTDERALTFHLAAATPVEQVTIRRGGLYGRTAGGLAEVVLRDAADVDLLLRTFHRARFGSCSGGFSRLPQLW